MEFWEALSRLTEYDSYEDKYICEVCGHKTNHEWTIWRHIDNKHPDSLYALSGRAHGWNAEISFTAGIKVGLARHEFPLDGPCVFCGYNSELYWQKGTHSNDCPFFNIGGEADRQDKLKEWGIK